MRLTEEEKKRTLKNFMREFFPYTLFREAGFFTKEMKGDHKAQAEKVCKFFGYETVYEYGAKEVSAHLTYANKKNPLKSDNTKPFITVFPNIYE